MLVEMASMKASSLYATNEFYEGTPIMSENQYRTTQGTGQICLTDQATVSQFKDNFEYADPYHVQMGQPDLMEPGNSIPSHTFNGYHQEPVSSSKEFYPPSTVELSASTADQTSYLSHPTLYNNVCFNTRNTCHQPIDQRNGYHYYGYDTHQESQTLVDDQTLQENQLVQNRSSQPSHISYYSNPDIAPNDTVRFETTNERYGVSSYQHIGHDTSQPQLSSSMTPYSYHEPQRQDLIHYSSQLCLVTKNSSTHSQQAEGSNLLDWAPSNTQSSSSVSSASSTSANVITSTKTDSLFMNEASCNKIKSNQCNSGIGGSSSYENSHPRQQPRSNQCGICGRNYARPSTLKTHLRTHTNERPFKCNVCNKTFSQAANLTAHQRVHTG